MSQRTAVFSLNAPLRNNRTDQLVSIWRARLPLGKASTVKSGLQLFSQGDPPRRLFLLASGLVKLTYALADGRDVVVHVCQPGRFVDTTSHLLDGGYATTARTLTECTVFTSETEVILDALNRDREATDLWVQQQAAELRHVHGSVVDQRSLTAQQRFEKLLWDLAALASGRSPSGAYRLPASITETQMAELIAVSIGEVSRMKRRLQRAGLIEHRRGGVVVTEAGALFHDVTQ